MEFFSIFLGNSYDEIGAYSQERTLGAKGGLGPPAQRKKKCNFFLLVIFFFLSRVAFLSFKNLDPFLISLAQLVTTNHLTKRTKKKKKKKS